MNPCDEEIAKPSWRPQVHSRSGIVETFTG